jgi:ribonuclease-3
VLRQQAHVAEALTRNAWLLERNSSERDYTSLQLLGEAVLNLIVTETLARVAPRARPGELKGIRQDLTSKKEVLAVGLEIGTGNHLRAGKGERAQRIHTSEKVADHMLSLIGAIYKASGPGGAEIFVHKLYARRWPKSGGGPLDSRAELEVRYRAEGGAQVSALGDVGTTAIPAYMVQVELPDGRVYTGTGRTPAIAEMHAARAALVG